MLSLCARGLTLHTSHSSAQFKVDCTAEVKLWGTNADACLNSSIESENRIFQQRSIQKVASCLLLIKHPKTMQVPVMVNGEPRLGLQSILFTKYLASSLLMIIIIIIIYVILHLLIIIL